MRKLLFLALLAVVVSCGEDAMSPDLQPGSRSGLISDATHGEDRNPGFWWLAPMVPQPAVDGTFQDGYSPRVTVVCLGTSPDCDGETPLVGSAGVADFTVGTGVMVETDHFQVQFDTRNFSLRTTTEGDTTTYRIIVETDPLAEFGGPFVLGYADFQLGDNGGSARNLAVPDAMIALVDNRTLPVKFYINEVAYAHELRQHAVANPGDEAFCLINCSVTVIPAGVAGTEASLHDEEGFELTSVQFGAEDVSRVLVIDERITDGADANCAPGRDAEKKNCFRYEASPAGPFTNDFRLGVCPVGITFGSGIWQLVQVRADGSATVHGDTDVSDFLPCEGNDGSPPPGPLSLLRPVVDFFVTPLYAEDTMLWGGTARDFSDFLWEVPATMTTTTARTGKAPRGSKVTLTVRVQATHPLLHNEPAVSLSGVEVIFEVAEGTGIVESGTENGSTLTVTTDADGYATVEHTVQAGKNRVVVRSPKTDNELDFTHDGVTDLLGVTLADDVLVIDGSRVQYTAVMSNDTAEPMSVVVLQGWVEQGTARRAGGGAQVLCGAGTGVLPPGVCTMSLTLGASNDPQIAGSGTLVGGAADAVIELKDDGVVIAEVRIPVTLVAPQ